MHFWALEGPSGPLASRCEPLGRKPLGSLREISWKPPGTSGSLGRAVGSLGGAWNRSGDGPCTIPPPPACPLPASCSGWSPLRVESETTPADGPLDPPSSCPLANPRGLPYEGHPWRSPDLPSTVETRPRTTRPAALSAPRLDRMPRRAARQGRHAHIQADQPYQHDWTGTTRIMGRSTDSGAKLAMRSKIHANSQRIHEPDDKCET